MLNDWDYKYTGFVNNIVTETYTSFSLLTKRRIEKGDKSWEGSLIYLTFSKMSYEAWIQKRGEFWHMLLKQEFKLNSLSTYQPFPSLSNTSISYSCIFLLERTVLKVFIQNRSFDTILDFSFSTSYWLPRFASFSF